MKRSLSVLGGMTAPFLLLGFLSGRAYSCLSAANQAQVVEALTGLASPFYFDVMASVTVVLVALRVVVLGPISTPSTLLEKAIFYWLPAFVLGFCLPFFSSLFGFFAGEPASYQEPGFLVLAVLALIWSAGFFILLVGAAHKSIPPRDPKLKRLMYFAVLLAVPAAMFMHYGI